MNKRAMAVGNPLQPAIGGLAGWLFARLRRQPQKPSRLTIIERISLAPRQSLALIEAEGHNFLVAVSPEHSPVFYSLEGGRLSREPLAQLTNSGKKKSGMGGGLSW